MEQNKQLKVLLGIQGTEQDTLISLALQTILDQTLAYINQKTLPEPLQRTVLLMAAAYFKAAALGSDSPATITSVKRGEVSTAFANPNNGESPTFGLGGGDGFFGWRTQLNAYRQLRWEL